MKWSFRKPLVVFTPKSLLRHPKCVSSINDLAKGRFQEVIDDAGVDKKKVKRVVFCSGKLYYDLLAAQEEGKHDTVALVRLEQLYPFPQVQIEKLLSSYSKDVEVVWAQEEPENMGAWNFIMRKWTFGDITSITRHESGSPASGSMKRFQLRQKEIIESVFTYR